MRIPGAALAATLSLAVFAACASDPTPSPETPATPAAPVATPGSDTPTSAAPSASTPASPAGSGATSSAPAAAAIPEPVDAIGGRLFDRFVGGGTYKGNFEPDQAKTKGAPDGKGGPRGDGTLLLAGGKPLLNDGGHDYRLKNLFGWDLRGKDGIYGPAYMNKPYVVSRNLLAGKETREQIATLLTQGDREIPALGGVLEPAQIDAVAAFVIGVRDGALPHPDGVFELRKGTPGNYALRAGGDAARGKAMIAERCSGCHGNDGTRFLFDDGEYSLGSHARQKAYEDWLKITNGQPGTGMKRQLRGATGKEMTQELLDLLAALCDRTAFPTGKATKGDVPDGDPRCGAYLK